MGLYNKISDIKTNIAGSTDDHSHKTITDHTANLLASYQFQPQDMGEDLFPKNKPRKYKLFRNIGSSIQFVYLSNLLTQVEV